MCFSICLRNAVTSDAHFSFRSNEREVSNDKQKYRFTRWMLRRSAEDEGSPPFPPGFVLLKFKLKISSHKIISPKNEKARPEQDASSNFQAILWWVPPPFPPLVPSLILFVTSSRSLSGETRAILLENNDLHRRRPYGPLYERTKCTRAKLWASFDLIPDTARYLPATSSKDDGSTVRFSQSSVTKLEQRWNIQARVDLTFLNFSLN